ncbi:hypothetical protein MATL_G00082420 [Megalops atlanticus]|uniref:General transcription factor IIIC subunit 4 n=1 Tax=Megalops atlanticus TaxID=7932 RepID=A0A9D3Q7D6_MEGAT|nr:hypothetical protein MATL_G00082420 [Megalops atlanticus]
MAAAAPDRGVDGGGAEPEPDTSAGTEPERVVKREPVVKLLSRVCGVEPLSWSEDHRVSACCASSIAVMEILPDVYNISQDLVIHRTSIPVPNDVHVLKVGPEREVQEAKEKLAGSPDPTVRQPFLLDRVMNPAVGMLPPMLGVRYASWSPLGCDASGRCLLAALTLDGRLAVHSCSGRLQWRPLLDLTEAYGELLAEAGYALPGAEPPLGPAGDPEELRRRHAMQTPVRMEWSGVCGTQQVQPNNECRDVGSVLLAVLMENGDIAVWHLAVPVLGRGSVVSCSALRSGVPSPSALAWWEFDHGGLKMTGLVVGSSAGPLRLLPVNLKAVKGRFTLRKPMVLCEEADLIPVHSVRCVSLYHPHQKVNCSLVLAARGPYLCWCLLLISRAGLSMYRSHVTGLHSGPIAAVTAARHGAGSVFTCSGDGGVRKLTPVFTQVAVTFRQERLELPEGVAGRRVHGVAVSPNGAYLALVTSEGMADGLHPVSRSCQVQLVALRTPEEAASELLRPGAQSLFRQMDLLDLVRWKVLQEKRVDPALQAELDGQVRSSGSTYLQRLQLFLLRVLYQSLQKAPAQARWRPALDSAKVFVGEEEEEEEEGEEEEDGSEGAAGGASEGAGSQDRGNGATKEQVKEITERIEAMETQLVREHMKKVLGEVYLHTYITENTSIPTRGMCDFLQSDPAYEDRATKVLIGHIFKKMNKQTFPEYCSLCREVLPFSDWRLAMCSNGHVWIRCVLTLQASQEVTQRRCLLKDSIARYPLPEDPDWMKRLLQGPCIFCDCPLF